MRNARLVEARPGPPAVVTKISAKTASKNRVSIITTTLIARARWGMMMKKNMENGPVEEDGEEGGAAEGDGQHRSYGEQAVAGGRSQPGVGGEEAVGFDAGPTFLGRVEQVVVLEGKPQRHRQRDDGPQEEEHDR